MTTTYPEQLCTNNKESTSRVLHLLSKKSFSSSLLMSQLLSTSSRSITVGDWGKNAKVDFIFKGFFNGGQLSNVITIITIWEDLSTYAYYVVLLAKSHPSCSRCKVSKISLSSHNNNSKPNDYYYDDEVVILLPLLGALKPDDDWSFVDHLTWVRP